MYILLCYYFITIFIILLKHYFLLIFLVKHVQKNIIYNSQNY